MRPSIWRPDRHPRVIINADDFGLSAAVNRAIVHAYEAGALSSTSLMVGGDVAQEAITIARQHSDLAVGLHVSFADVKPSLPLDAVSMLVRDGRFPSDDRLLHLAVRSAEGRRQIRAEIAAQIAAFHATGLVCDHINTHRNVHLRPAIGVIILHEAARAKIPTIRIPWDPAAVMGIINIMRFVRFASLRRLAALYRLRSPDLSIGRIWDAAQLAEVLSTLLQGVTEIYCHPVQTEADEAHQFADDLPSLLSEDVSTALRGVLLHGYRSALMADRRRYR